MYRPFRRRWVWRPFRPRFYFFGCGGFILLALLCLLGFWFIRLAMR